MFGPLPRAVAEWVPLLLSPQNAIAASLNYSRCLALSGNDRTACQLDKAMANVGSMLAAEVEGRVCTEVDPRLCNDSSECGQLAGVRPHGGAVPSTPS
jgi:hypothetical protein